MTFTVQLQPSGRTFHVEPGERILAGGLASGVSLPYGCRMGTCCSCRGRVLQGKVDLGDAHPAYLPQSKRDEGYALLCQAEALSDVVIEIGELPDLAQPQVAPALVKGVKRLADDVMWLHLRLPLHLYLHYAAGQYVDLILEDGVRRSYSIANPPNVDGVIDLEFHIRHMPGGLFTDRLFAGLKPREKIQFEGPLGTFFLRRSEKPAILLASGTGYAPIRAVLLDALAKGEQRKMVVYWGARARKDLYLLKEAADIAAGRHNVEFVPVLSEPVAQDNWDGRTGLVHRAVMADHPDLSGWQVYACGAPVMVDAARSDLSRMCGLPDAEFFADSFVTRADLA